jgi:hypothetical protein
LGWNLERRLERRWRGLIGGIVLSMLVTLVLVPVFYVLIERLRGGGGVLLAAPSTGGPMPDGPNLPGTGIRSVILDMPSRTQK